MNDRQETDTPKISEPARPPVTRRRFGSTSHLPPRPPLAPTGPVADPDEAPPDPAWTKALALGVAQGGAGAEWSPVTVHVATDSPAPEPTSEPEPRPTPDSPTSAPATPEPTPAALAPAPTSTPVTALSARPQVVLEKQPRSGETVALDRLFEASLIEDEPTRPKPGTRQRLPVILAVAVLILCLIGISVAVVAYRNDGGDSQSAPLVVKTRAKPTPGSATATGPGGTRPGSATPSPSDANTEAPIPLEQQRQAMTTWVGANLSRSAAVVADPVTASQLRLAGFTSARDDNNLVGVTRQGVDYLVSVPSADTPSTERNELADASAALATFSVGPDAITVAQVFAGGSDDLAQRRADSLRGRQLAAQQLPLNPSVQFMGSTKKIVASGSVDLRSMTVLVVLAQQSTIWIRDITIDPAEARAGQPARTITITVDNSQSTQTILAGLPVLYRPQTISALSPGTLRLIWAPAVAPVVTAGQ